MFVILRWVIKQLPNLFNFHLLSTVVEHLEPPSFWAYRIFDLWTLKTPGPKKEVLYSTIKNKSSGFTWITGQQPINVREESLLLCFKLTNPSKMMTYPFITLYAIFGPSKTREVRKRRVIWKRVVRFSS
jgi:hypothetical protein